MRKSFVHRSVRPSLTIEMTSSRSLGHCYTEANYRVTSTRPLTHERLRLLFQAGFLGVGQEFIVNSKCDGTEGPAGFDDVPCIVIDDHGNVLPEVAINPYSGRPYGSQQQPYFTYETCCRCDSGD